MFTVIWPRLVGVEKAHPVTTMPVATTVPHLRDDCRVIAGDDGKQKKTRPINHQASGQNHIILHRAKVRQAVRVVPPKDMAIN